jgi:uncharacterized protein
MISQAKNAHTQTIGQQIFRFPLVRILIAFLIVGAGILVAQLLISLLRAVLPQPSPVYYLIAIVLALVCGYFAYWLYVRLIEHRPLSELAFKGAPAELGIGILAGIGLYSAVIGLLWLLGSYSVNGSNPWLVIFPALAANVPSGFLQEILFRGIVFHIVEEALGTLWALVISAVLFALIHLASAQASLVGAISNAAEAGILFAAAYLLTRRLWLAIGIHVAWDFANDGIFGVSVSGSAAQPLPGLFHGNLSGPAQLTGGAGGIEASLVTVLVMAAACGLLLWISRRRMRPAHAGEQHHAR